MQLLINAKTKGILITNPSNPCGSNFSAEHLLCIIGLARKYGLPVIADEIYGGCVFDSKMFFTPISSLSEDVMVLSLGGIAKEFVVPGWRVGWISLYDGLDSVNHTASDDTHTNWIQTKNSHREGVSEIRAGLKSLSQIILGASSLIQAALPRILTPVPGSMDDLSLSAFHLHYMNTLSQNTQLCLQSISKIPELSMSIPKGNLQPQP